MVYADNGGLSDENRALLAPIVGMAAPSHVREQASRVPQAPLLEGFVGAWAFEQSIGEAYQLLRMHLGACPQLRDILAGREQRVLLAISLVQELVHDAFADAESGENHVGWLHLADDRVQ